MKKKVAQKIPKKKQKRSKKQEKGRVHHIGNGTLLPAVASKSTAILKYQIYRLEIFKKN